MATCCAAYGSSLMPRYEVTVGDRTLHIDLRHEGDLLFVRVDDGDEQPASMQSVHGPLHALVIGERRAELMAVPIDDGVSLTVGGVDYRAEVIDEEHARLASVAGGRAASHSRRELRAPMPGLLVKLLAQVGDAIEANQPIAVLQAMKMENELSLPRAGTVTELLVEAGQTVEQNQVLVVVE